MTWDWEGGDLIWRKQKEGEKRASPSSQPKIASITVLALRRWLLAYLCRWLAFTKRVKRWNQNLHSFSFAIGPCANMPFQDLPRAFPSFTLQALIEHPQLQTLKCELSAPRYEKTRVEDKYKGPWTVSRSFSRFKGPAEAPRSSRMIYRICSEPLRSAVIFQMILPPAVHWLRRFWGFESVKRGRERSQGNLRLALYDHNSGWSRK